MMRIKRYGIALLAATVGMAGLAFAGIAIADAASPSQRVPQSVSERFEQVLRSAPNLTSRAMLHRLGVSRSLSASAHSFTAASEMTTTTTLSDGTVLTPPPANASPLISQDQAWSAFQAYGDPPGVVALNSTPAPTVDLAQLTKPAINGNAPISALVWAISYQSVAIYPSGWANHQVFQNGAWTPFDPFNSVGYMYALVDANSGQVLYTLEHAAYSS
jgi:hypothetical protein